MSSICRAVWCSSTDHEFTSRTIISWRKLHLIIRGIDYSLPLRKDAASPDQHYTHRQPFCCFTSCWRRIMIPLETYLNAEDPGTGPQAIQSNAGHTTGDKVDSQQIDSSKNACLRHSRNKTDPCCCQLNVSPRYATEARSELLEGWFRLCLVGCIRPHPHCILLESGLNNGFAAESQCYALLSMFL